ncbi:MAG: hypothetical protein ACOVN2_02540, partial [Usitatibacteraceae bacterium]
PWCFSSFGVFWLFLLAVPAQFNARLTQDAGVDPAQSLRCLSSSALFRAGRIGDITLDYSNEC